MHIIAVTARSAQPASDEGVQDHRIADRHVRDRATYR
jgi:hypothetical protein